MIRDLLPALRALLVLTAVTGVAYPVAVTVAGRVLFRDASEGSPLRDARGNKIGSALIGQRFEQPRYLQGRPSAAGSGYDGASSGGTNVSPVGSAIATAVEERRAAVLAANPGAGEPPLQLLTASASGLDPHVSPEAALYQVPRIAKARGASPTRVRDLVLELAEGRTLGVLGEPRVNVLLFNLELDRRFP